MSPTTQPTLRRIAVRKAGAVRLTAAAAALYDDGCTVKIPPIHIGY